MDDLEKIIAGMHRIIKPKYGLCIKNGVLILENPLDDKQKTWFSKNKHIILSEIEKKLPDNVYRYDGYSVGLYEKKQSGMKYPHKKVYPHNKKEAVNEKYSGITLTFVNVETGETAYIICNCELTRQRTTKHGKKGSPLPDGHFIPKKHSDFVNIWKKTGLKSPRGLSAFYGYMGNLKEFLFLADLKKGKTLDKSSLEMLCLNNLNIGLLYEIQPSKPILAIQNIKPKETIDEGSLFDDDIPGVFS